MRILKHQEFLLRLRHDKKEKGLFRIQILIEYFEQTTKMQQVQRLKCLIFRLHRYKNEEFVVCQEFCGCGGADRVVTDCGLLFVTAILLSY